MVQMGKTYGIGEEPLDCEWGKASSSGAVIYCGDVKFQSGKSAIKVYL